MDDEVTRTDDPIGRYARAALGESRICGAMTRSGKPCGRATIVGGFRCPHHGGNTPQARQAAKNRLVSLVHPALDVLERTVEDGQPGDPVALKAAQIILDRTGYPARLAVVAETGEDMSWTAYLTRNELAQVSTLVALAKQRQANGEEPPPEVAVVDEGDVADGAVPEGDGPGHE